ncbi:hypothetical protein DFQ27_001367 [Actinomortierella ambigua]|uniref:chitin synthase n=1 Tax=Actinomortierella ambigua TaxID=1343610 RepID=A0A9P6QAC8_9FUNG|nr:hypothetical protein DFQ26_002038 [Actinomortierella ambigua]KAG0264183.1 hypothetical protein DFQ27_001367 [Actinomortierella ambigua]
MSGRPPGVRRMPTNGGLAAAPSVRRGATLSRGKTLSRPERYHNPETMFKRREEDEPASCWVVCSRIVTCWSLPPFMRMCGLSDKGMQQAWREKFTLCFIIFMIGAMVAFLTMGFTFVLCPTNARQGAQQFNRYGDSQFEGLYGIGGYMFKFFEARPLPKGLTNLKSYQPGADVTDAWRRGVGSPACNGLTSRVANFDNCLANNTCGDKHVTGPINDQSWLDYLSATYNLEPSMTPDGTPFKVGYDWSQMARPELENYFVIDGNVLDFEKYMEVYPDPIPDDRLDAFVRNIIGAPHPEGGKDATKLFFRSEELKRNANCLVTKFGAGFIDKATAGCFAADLFMYVSLTVVLGVLLTRFVMAVIFNWFLSAKLARPPPREKVQTMASAASSGSTIVASGAPGVAAGALARSATSVSTAVGNPAELYSVMLVTCYSEGEASLRTTIESLAATEYPDNKKLLFIICDGIITGSGNDRSTPDICLSLMELDPAFDPEPTPQSYIAVAAGAKQHNRAKVYAGHFRWKNKRVPTVLIVKCGSEAEQDKPKAGNRGKRDSQLVLMNFFMRVTYNDRMTPLDFELFRKIQHLMNVTPDHFEICLMVDADTKVYPSSLRLLLNCMGNDPLIMGLCGETKIANKRQSWVTGIQVFEYYISHHLGKGFESVFGGVTCLPGCFCMYRLKARKGDDWIPIITKPEIVQEYSQNVVETLHQKNLLLLGEDRFLTTLMLRNFPSRKMMFMPQAICKTVVPDEFNVLLSQRRRWINSTIHNLLELVLVRNLCGTFCFSMQFVIFMELIGTVVLPMAMILMVILIVMLCMNPIDSIAQAVPLIMLVFVLMLPAIMILLTTRKLIYIAWMFVYLLALPVWNFILPLYAYWHFDDFSWGETRKVAGEAKGEAHGNADGVFDASKVPLKRWDDYEKARVRQVKRIERAERQRQQSPYLGSGTRSIYTDMDGESDMFSDLGPQQQHFDYNGRQLMAPPLVGNQGRPMMMGPGGPPPRSPGVGPMMGGPPRSPNMAPSMGGGGPMSPTLSFQNAPPPSAPGGMRRNRTNNSHHAQSPPTSPR